MNPPDNFMTAENQPVDLLQVRRLRRDALFASVQRLGHNRAYGRETPHDAKAVNAAVAELLDSEIRIATSRDNFNRARAKHATR
jgi:hypothetical protein